MRDGSIRERVSEHGEEESLRAAVYARTSSTTQKQGRSLDAQVSRCVERAESLGWDVAFVFRDEAESGKNTDRPMFKEMVKAVENQAFDVAIFWKLDRFSRSLMHAVQLESQFREHGVSLYSVTEQVDTTSPTGRFNFRNLASAAEFERDMIRKRTQLGLNQLAENYEWPNDTPPLGYDISSEGRLVVNEEERNLVIRIFQMYLEYRSMPDVASHLNDMDIPTQEGSEWSPRAVGDILRNEIYRGRYEVGDVSEYVSEYQIVPDETFEQVTETRMRFQTGDASRDSMPETRKERMVEEMRESYSEYLDGTQV